MGTNGNGKDTGGSMNGGVQVMQVNPIEIARHLMMFLGRAEFRAHERLAFDQCELVCEALRSGQLVLAQAEHAPLAVQGDAAQPLNG